MSRPVLARLRRGNARRVVKAHLLRLHSDVKEALLSRDHRCFRSN